MKTKKMSDIQQQILEVKAEMCDVNIAFGKFQVAQEKEVTERKTAFEKYMGEQKEMLAKKQAESQEQLNELEKRLEKLEAVAEHSKAN